MYKTCQLHQKSRMEQLDDRHDDHDITCLSMHKHALQERAKTLRLRNELAFIQKYGLSSGTHIYWLTVFLPLK